MHPPNVTISDSAMNVLLGKDNDDGEVEDFPSAWRRSLPMGEWARDLHSEGVIQFFPHNQLLHLLTQFTSQRKLWLVKVLRERRRRRNGHKKKRQQGRPQKKKGK